MDRKGQVRDSKGQVWTELMSKYLGLFANIGFCQNNNGCFHFPVVIEILIADWLVGV